MTEQSPYPPIGDYALISDCHSAALVSRHGSIDWCCMPRMDFDSCFGRLLDWERGGTCTLAPSDGAAAASWRYLDQTLVLETVWQAASGRVRVLDLFTMHPGGREAPNEQLVRVVEGLDGALEMALHIAPRFDLGTTRPWLRAHDDGVYTAIGGQTGLVFNTDIPLELQRFALHGRATIRAGERLHLSIEHAIPHHIYPEEPPRTTATEIDTRLDESIAWWRRWSAQAQFDAGAHPHVLRSAIVIKALTHAPTGAIAAAATTSLPESIGGARNWDYRFSWIRDSSFALRSLLALGFAKEAHGFRAFIERTVAGDAAELQVLYGLSGEHRVPEVTIDGLSGYRGSRPVRVGNAAHEQLQNDIYGELLDVSWLAAQRGAPPNDVYWRLLVEVVESACRVWRQPDHGIWEIRDQPRHFVHSKVMCWAALDRGIRLAQHWQIAEPPPRRWSEIRDEIRRAVEAEGYDAGRGIFVQAFGSDHLDAALLLLPRVEFVAWDDPRMIRTVDAIRRELTDDGWLVRRYRSGDGLDGREGSFLACTFWLCECLAYQGRTDEAREIFRRGCAVASDLGLFAEEFDPATGELLGNFPQGLSHYSHISAAVALGLGTVAAAKD